MPMPGRRLVFLLIFLVCAALMAVAFYMEYVMGLEPCPLCWLQRIAISVVGILALIAALHNPKEWGGRIYGLFLAVFSAVGVALAGRQLWLQSLPEDQVPACGPSVDYLLDVMPILDVFRIALQGTGDCAQVVWRFLGLSIPGWTAIFFTLLFVLGIAILFGAFGRQRHL
ncbi:disulfide bond formation protein B [Marinobacter nanhaiticus D15-8W]|uniref:Disulfide bond formation protein B n=2 Tax=Marinobacter TaxID=2742 RepID=N6WTB6_9GAMM|nr:disulfide bond formation protein B [Marinobacter nanhaiticus D15-8W]